MTSEQRNLLQTWLPVIVLVVLLPISFAGVGTANAAFAVLFGIAGVEPEIAFVLSVLFLSLGTLGNLPGGLLMATGRGPGAAPRT